MGYKSPHMYALSFGHANGSPADLTTYYIGGMPALAAGTVITLFQMRILKSGRITGFYHITEDGAAVGSNEAWPVYIRVNNTTDYLVDTQAVASQFRVWQSTVLSIPVTQGDDIVVKWITPAWVTNPINNRGWGYILIECE